MSDREYDAFGNLLTSSGSPWSALGYAGAGGYTQDAESGFTCVGHRFYDPGTGRFLTSDPIKSGRNWSAYCANNPVGRIDPSGLQAAQDPGWDGSYWDGEKRVLGGVWQCVCGIPGGIVRHVEAVVLDCGVPMGPHQFKEMCDSASGEWDTMKRAYDGDCEAAGNLVGQTLIMCAAGAAGELIPVPGLAELTPAADAEAAAESGAGLASEEGSTGAESAPSVQRIDPSKIAGPSPAPGRAPVGEDGFPIEFHHGEDGLVEMTRTDHRLGQNFADNHPAGRGPAPGDRIEFDKFRRDYWKNRQSD